MTSYTPAKKGVEWIGYISLPSRASAFTAQANPTIASGDFKVSIDGGALANLSTLPVVTPASSKMVKITLSTSEMNGDNVTVVASDAAGSEWGDVIFNLQTSARQIDDLAYPTTSGRSIDVTAGGNVGVDWANVESPTTTLALTGTTIATTQKVDVETIKTNAVVNGGTVTFPTNSTLASTTNITAGTVTTATNVTTVNGLAANVITAASMAADASAEIADAVWDEDATGHQTGGTFGQAIGDPGADTTTIYQSVVTDAAGTNVAADIIAIKAETASILTDTAEIGSAGAGLTNINLPDQTMNITGNITGNLSGSVGSVTGAVGSVTAGVTLAASAVQAIWDALTTALTTVGSIGKLLVDNVNATISSRASQTTLDTLDDFVDTEVAAIKAKTDQLVFTAANQLDVQVLAMAANVITAASMAADASAEIADAVWDEAIAGHAGAGSTGEALSAAGSAGDPWTTVLPGAYGAGTAGKIIGDNINATISSRASQTSVDDLPTNAELTTALGTADDAVLTAIDALPTNAELATALGTADDAVLAQIALVKTETDKIASIKTKTDSLTFTVAGQVDANAESMNGTTILGNGSSGDLWRG